MNLLFVQSTGALYRDGTLLDMAYAGHGAGLNNPAMQAARMVGPLPCGWYTAGKAQQGTHLGPNAIPLIPDKENEMHGRSAFYIHADNAKRDHSASEGCIVAGNGTRALIVAQTEPVRLQVVADKPKEKDGEL